MKTIKNKKTIGNTLFYAAAALLCLTVFASCLCVGLPAQYRDGASGRGGARVARFVSEIEVSSGGAQRLDLSELKKPGDCVFVRVKVTNADGNAVSEAAQSFQLLVETMGYLPLQFEVTKDGLQMASGALPSDRVVVDAKAHTTTYIFTDESWQFACETESTADLQLKVNWMEERNDSGYIGKLDLVTLKLVVSQID